MAKVKLKAVEAALQEMQGNVSAAARRLGLSRSHLNRMIDASAELQAVVDDARQSMVDNAESALNRAVITGEAWAVCFTLKTQGKRRGYVERIEVDTDWREQAQKDGIPADTISDVFERMVSEFANKLQTKGVADDSGSGDADV